MLELPHSITNTVRHILPLQVQLKMLATLIMLSGALLLSLVFTKKEQSLTPRFGVYWDKKGNSYCPSCKALTSQIYWVSHDNKQWHGLHCSNCNKTFLTIDAGEPMHVQDAMRRMAKR